MNRSKKTVIVHIGAGKTGSTAIQNCLLSNAELLSRNGVLVPASEYFLKAEPDVMDPSVPISCGNAIRLYFFLAGYGSRPKTDEETFLKEVDAALRGPHRFIIFSCEILQYGKADRFAKFKEFCEARGAELKIVYCVRDFASHAFSAWRQLLIHNAETATWPQFQRKYVQTPGLSSFEGALRIVQSVFSPGDIVVLNHSTLGRKLTG